MADTARESQCYRNERAPPAGQETVDARISEQHIVHAEPAKAVITQPPTQEWCAAGLDCASSVLAAIAVAILAGPRQSECIFSGASVDLDDDAGDKRGKR